MNASPPLTPDRRLDMPRSASDLPGVSRRAERTSDVMKITIFGATGTTGTYLVGQALTGGHQVTAAVRDPVKMKVKAHPGLQVAIADVMDPASVVPLVVGAEVAYSALGPPGKGPTTILRDSTHSIIQAMATTDNDPPRHDLGIDDR